MKSERRRDLFLFTSKEKKGIFILLGVLFLLVIIRAFLPYFDKSDNTDMSFWEQEADHYLISRQDRAKPSPVSLVAFNPNETDSQKLVAMGIPSRAASNWRKYLEKGGRFKKKEDIRKIYGITPQLYNELQSFIKIPEGKTAKVPLSKNRENFIRTPSQRIPVKRDLPMLDVNKADSAQLENLPGLGPVLSSRIIRFREKLGGFYSLSQLKEVYGLRDEHFLAASPYLFTEKSGIKKFNVNFSTLSELGRHPYIGYRTAGQILNLRDRLGKINSINDLTGIEKDSLKRLKPYLIFD